MRLSRTTARTIGPALVLALASLTACGEDDSKAADDDTTSSASPTDEGEETSGEEPSEDSSEEDSSEQSDDAEEEPSEDTGASGAASSEICEVITPEAVGDAFGSKATPAEYKNGCGYMLGSNGTDGAVNAAAIEPPNGQDVQAGLAQARKQSVGKAEDLPQFGDGAFISIANKSGATMATAVMEYGDGVAIFSASYRGSDAKPKLIKLMELAQDS